MGKFWAVLALGPLLAAGPNLGCVTATGSGHLQQEHEPVGPVTTVGHPNDPDHLGQELAEAYANGARRFAIRAGTYQFSLAGHSILALDHWKDARITGHNANLISSEKQWGNEVIHMNGCTNVIVEDLTLSQTWQTALQGRVISVSLDGAGKTVCTWKPDDGYPVPAPGSTRFNKGPNIVDSKTRLLKQGCGDEWDAGLEPADGGAYKVTFGHKVNLATGDWLVSRGEAAPCKVHLIDCHGCTLSNLTLLRNAFGSILENDGGGNSYFDLHWQLGARPPEALEKPIVSCSVDGFHSTGAYPGPDIENCDFAGVLLDDCITVHGSLQTVKSSSGDSIVVDQDGGRLKAGQPVRIGAPGFFENAFAKSVSPNGDHTVTVQLDRSLNVPAGAMVGNPLFNGQSFKVLNCHLGNTRSRGILVKADSGLIQGNVISNCGMSAVSAGPEYNWKEGDYVQDLSIKDNQILRNGFVGRDIAAVWVHGEGARGNHNVTIEGNSFDGNFSGDILLQWTAGATVRQNTFTAPASEPPGLARPHSISLESSSDIQIVKNLFKDPTGYRQPQVEVRKDVERVHQDTGS